MTRAILYIIHQFVDCGFVLYQFAGSVVRAYNQHRHISHIQRTNNKYIIGMNFNNVNRQGTTATKQVNRLRYESKIKLSIFAYRS